MQVNVQKFKFKDDRIANMQQKFMEKHLKQLEEEKIAQEKYIN